jgi:hypothetical protein
MAPDVPDSTVAFKLLWSGRMTRKGNKIRPFRDSSDDDPIRELGTRFWLGPKSSRWLYDAGVRTRADIERLGAIEVCRRILAAGHPIAVVVAYALEAGLTGCRWDALPVARQLEIKKAFYVIKRGHRFEN